MTPLELYSQQPSSTYEAKLHATMQLLKDVTNHHHPLVQATSLGVEDMVITDLIQKLALPIQISMLDTGCLHKQTLSLKTQVELHYGISIKVFQPDAEAVLHFVQENGADGIFKSPAIRKQCCHIRKLVPLQALLAGYKGWITGLRREQSSFRSNLQEIETETTQQGTNRIKVNPLIEWTIGDVWHYVKQNSVPYNTLHDEFFVSIGCEPCTRAIALGEDFRAGRWWWEQEGARECGLHVHESSSENISLLNK